MSFCWLPGERFRGVPERKIPRELDRSDASVVSSTCCEIKAELSALTRAPLQASCGCIFTGFLSL